MGVWRAADPRRDRDLGVDGIRTRWHGLRAALRPSCHGGAMAIYERPVRGSDVLARATTAGVPEHVCGRIRVRIAPEECVEDLDGLARLIAPDAIGMSPGAWTSVFGPLFGEFE